MHRDYTLYSKEEFLQDEFFIRSVKYPNVFNVNFWQKFSRLQAQNHNEYLAAKNELEYMLAAAIRIYPPKGDKEQAWSNISAFIPEAQKQYSKIQMIRRWSVAASIALLIFVSATLAYHNYYGKVNIIRTAFNHTRELLLPDSSRIILNANSDVKYAVHWKLGCPREVWLNGEGYFEVNHQNRDPGKILNSERFLVHTGNLEIQVLGTIFNIKSRPSDHNVTLVSGRLAVRSVGEQRWHLLKPSESFRYDATSRKEVITKAHPDLVTAWKDRSVILPNNTRLKDIIPQLEDNYGIRIVLSSSAIGNKRLEGTLPLTNQENLFFILSNVLKVNIQKQDNTWIFKTQTP